MSNLLRLSAILHLEGRAGPALVIDNTAKENA